MVKEVDDWMSAYQNPMKQVVQRVREIILGADPRIEECIKWKTPTFTFNGNLASFNPRARHFASLMFHTGAEIPGDHPRLKGTGDVARYLNFASVAEADHARKDLEAIVASWIALKAETTEAPRKEPARKVTPKAETPIAPVPSTKKAATKKAPGKKAATKKAPTKKAAGKKAATKKAATKKTATKKTATKKAPTKKAAGKKAATKKAPGKKTAGKKTAIKKATTKKTSKA